MKAYFLLVAVVLGAPEADHVFGHVSGEKQGQNQVLDPEVQGAIVNTEAHVVSQEHQHNDQTPHQNQQHNEQHHGDVGSVVNHEHDVHGHNEGSVVGQHDRGTCQAPNQQGLNALIREEIRMIPVKKIREMSTRRMRTDPEVRRLAEYLNSEELRTTLREIKKSRQFMKLKDYACNKLFMSMRNFWDLYNAIYDLPNPSSHQELDGTLSGDRQGVRGLYEDISRLMPTAQMREIFQRRENTDEYLHVAMERLRSNEYRELLNDVCNLPEYRIMANKMSELGLPVSKIISTMRKSLGFSKTDILLVEVLNVLMTV